MLLSKLAVVIATALILVAGVAPGAHAQIDYPPTTGSPVTGVIAITTPTVAKGETAIRTDLPASPEPRGRSLPEGNNSSLPFTGDNAQVLGWVGLAFLGVGAFAASRSWRRRASAG